MFCRAFVSALLAVGVFSFGTVVANAADKSPVAAPPSTIGWTFEFTPYLWAAGLKGNVDLGPGLPPPVSVDAGFDDVLKHLKIAFMGTFEARYGRDIGLIADLSYLSVKVNATGPAGYVGGRLTDQTFFGTVAGAYRVVDQGSVWLDVLAGARIWSRDSTVTITAPGPVAMTRSASEAWIDPVLGLRARAYASPKFFFEVYADGGGFGIGAKSDWQIAATLGYEYSKSVTFIAGYRYMAVDYNRSGYLFDVAMSGPVIGLTLKF